MSIQSVQLLGLQKWNIRRIESQSPRTRENRHSAKRARCVGSLLQLHRKTSTVRVHQELYLTNLNSKRAGRTSDNWHPVSAGNNARGFSQTSELWKDKMQIHIYYFTKKSFAAAER